MANWTWDSLKRVSTVLKTTTKVVGTPIKYIYKGTKAALAGVLGYGKGLVTDTFWGIKAWYNEVGKWFKSSSTNLNSSLKKSKDAISNTFWAGIDGAKGLGSIVKGWALGIFNVFKGVANGTVINPAKRILWIKTSSNTAKIIPIDSGASKSKAA